jgi:mRNA-degrading endonuclease RelE of RelBE toxin-antitoxin system
LYISKFSDTACEQIKRLPKNVKNSLKKEFKKTIERDPIGCSEELSGVLKDFRSFHFSEYRVIYRVFEDLRAIAVVGVSKKNPDHQTDIYKRLEALAESGEIADSVLKTMRLFSIP